MLKNKRLENLLLSNFMRLKIIIGILLAGLFIFSIFALAQDKDYARVKGRITTFWGEPIEKAEVSFYELEGISGISPREKLIRSVITDKEGNYNIEKLPWGQYRVDISASYGGNEVWRFYLARNANEVLDVGVPMGYLHLISEMSVSGIVRQVDGSPVANATVTLTNAYDARKIQQTRTDEKGKYKFNTIQVGDFILSSAKSGFYPSAATLRINNGEQKTADIKLEVAPKLDILQIKEK